MVEARRQKTLVLILAREFASNLATPMFIADDQGRLVYYNEPAEAIIGRTYAEAGEISLDELVKVFSPEALDGNRIELEMLPSVIAFRERRPAHDEFRITGLDGKKREISATAFPLFGRGQELEGVVAIFWERSN